MRLAWLVLLGVLVAGCASPSPPKKPSPYRYTTNALLLALGAQQQEPS
jgi:hypothetical protein